MIRAATARAPAHLRALPHRTVIGIVRAYAGSPLVLGGCSAVRPLAAALATPSVSGKRASLLVGSATIGRRTGGARECCPGHVGHVQYVPKRHCTLAFAQARGC